jgi:hypothetical protein
LSDRYSLIRSMTTRQGTHGDCLHMCLSGRPAPASEHPHFGSILARLRPSTRNVPSYVWLQRLEEGGNQPASYLTGGSLGRACAPLLIGDRLDNPSAPGFRVKAFDPAEGLTAERILERQALAGRLPTRPIRAGQFGRLHQRAFDIVSGPAARRSFNLEEEPARVRDRYGRHPLGQNLLLARRLIEGGVRLVSVNGWTGLAPGTQLHSVNVWDGHGNVPYIGNTFGTGTYGLRFMLPRLDQAVSALLEDLELRGRLHDTLVVVAGEFGRTPRINNMGREHWPNCYSAMLAGGGVRAGVVYGSSDGTAAYVKDSPVGPEAFAATIFRALGIPPETRLSPDGFTEPVSTGEAIAELLA